MDELRIIKCNYHWGGEVFDLLKGGNGKDLYLDNLKPNIHEPEIGREDHPTIWGTIGHE